MAREPAEIAERRRALGRRLATFRCAAQLTQAELAHRLHYQRASLSNIENGHQPSPRQFWQEADTALAAGGVLLRDYDELVTAKQAHQAALAQQEAIEQQCQIEKWQQAGEGLNDGSLELRSPSGGRPTDLFAIGSLWAPEYFDVNYLETIRKHIDQIISLDNRFGGADLSQLSERFFRTIHNQLGAGTYEPGIRKDLLAAAGELAEVAGWLAYDADRQDAVRRMNQEALYFTRLAGDKSMELLTLQNASMHAGFLDRPEEALDLAEMVLSGGYQLSPRLRALFLTRKARALAQGGDPTSLRIFDEIRSLYLDGTEEGDPPWAWWIDERELAWHEAMCLQTLGDSRSAIARFERSVEATPTTEVRSQYLHRAYLLDAQANLRSWDAAEATLKKLEPLATEVASTRTAVLLQKALTKLQAHETNSPGRVIEQSKSLQRALALAPV